MATQSNTGERAAVEQLVSARRSVGGGLLWAVVMLLILAFWLKARDADFGIILWGPVFLLAVGALVLGVRELVVARAAAPVREVLLAGRRQLAYALFGA